MNNTTPVHTDLFGQPLAVGDCVAFPNTNHMLVGTVIKLNPKMVKIKRVDTKWTWSMNKYPNDLVKVHGAEVTMYLLKNSKSA
jgi:hypothetical protein